MRNTLPWIVVAAALASCSCGESPGDGGSGPNLILIVVDTLRADHILDPDDRVDTPRIDELAQDGIVFSEAFSHTSWTLPSHTTIFSSRHPHESGVILNGQTVPEDLPLLPEWLHRRGWRTRAVVSLSSLIPVGADRFLDRGFEVYHDRMRTILNTADVASRNAREALEELAAKSGPFMLFAHFSDPHEPYSSHGTDHAEAEVLLDGKPVATIPSLADYEPFEGRFSLEPGVNRIEVRSDAALAVKYIGCTGPDGELEVERHAGERGSVVAEVKNPSEHEIEASVVIWAWERPDGDVARRRYRLEVEYLDAHVGEVIDELKRLGLYEDALIVLTSDHGEGLGEHGLVDHGLNVFDELLHVPLIIKPPAGHRAWEALALRRDDVARHIDLAPTILDILDQPALPGQRGVSLLEGTERLLLAEMHAKILDDQYMLSDGRHKLMYAPGPDRFALFDLLEDPDERHDLFAGEGDAFLEWQAELRRVAAISPDAAEIERVLPKDLEAKLKAFGYVGER